MAEPLPPLAELIQYRDQLVACRRQTVRTALFVARETGGEYDVVSAGELKQMQERIEAIDRAIEDERRLEESACTAPKDQPKLRRV